MLAEGHLLHTAVVYAIPSSCEVFPQALEVRVVFDSIYSFLLVCCSSVCLPRDFLCRVVGLR